MCRLVNVLEVVSKMDKLLQACLATVKISILEFLINSCKLINDMHMWDFL